MANKKKIYMNEKHIVRIAMALSGDTIKTAGEKTGIHPNVLSSQLNRFESTMTLTSIYSVLNSLGFDIIVKDRDGKYGGKEFVLSDISESSAEWDKILAMEKANAEIRKIEEQSAHKSDIDRIKADTSKKAEPRKPIRPLPTRKMK